MCVFSSANNSLSFNQLSHHSIIYHAHSISSSFYSDHVALAEYLQYMLIRLGPVGAPVPVWGKMNEIYNPKTAWNTVMKSNQLSCSENGECLVSRSHFEGLVEGTNDLFDKQFRPREKRLEDILKNQPGWLFTWVHHLLKLHPQFSREQQGTCGEWRRHFVWTLVHIQPEQIRKDKLRKEK